MIFSQTNISYYYYENGTGYQYIENTNTAQGDPTNNEISAENANFFYDDGFNTIAGYQTSTINSISALLPTLINVSRSSQ